MLLNKWLFYVLYCSPQVCGKGIIYNLWIKGVFLWKSVCFNDALGLVILSEQSITTRRNVKRAAISFTRD